MTAENPGIVNEFDAALTNLLKLARELTADDDVLPAPAGIAAENFVQSVSEYLDRFEQWTKLADRYNAGPERDQLPDPEKQRLKRSIEDLVGLHLAVIELANRHKDDVAEQMGEVHKRAQGLRRYVDRLPQRVTIAGKRKG
jgi:hypothetical protein